MDYRKLRLEFISLIEAMPDAKLAAAFKAASAIVESKLPIIAPALWSERPKGITAVNFFREHYGPYISQGLNRTHLHSLDLPLYEALSTWIGRQKVIPEDLHCLLITRSDEVDAELADAGITKPEDVRVKFPDDRAKVARLSAAARLRAKKPS